MHAAPRLTVASRLLKRVDVILLALLVLGALGLVLSTFFHKHQQPVSNSVSTQFGNVALPLSQFVGTEDGIKLDAGSVVVNGALKLNQGVVITPSVQPNAPVSGQLYFDRNTNQLAYFNGTAFVPLGASTQAVQTIGGLSGQVTLGGGLSVVGNQLVSSTAGVTGVVAGTNISVTNNNGVYTVSNTGAGTGTVTSGGGTAGTLPLFTGVQNVENSIVAQSGGAITVGGNLNVSGSLALGTALGVASGGTGAATLAANGVLLGNGGGAVSSLVAGGAGLCLVSSGGAPTWASCSGGGVTSLNGLAGALTVANASGVGSTVTINDAGIGTKGIASFDGTNFSVVGGAVNTVQNISTGSSPTFVAVNTNSITPSAALTVGASGQTLTLQGGASTVFKATAGGNTTTVDFTSPTANTTLHFPASPAGPYTICTTVGNCAGSGGGVTGSGTNNQIVKFTSNGSTVGDSSLSDSGGAVTTSGDLVIQGGDVTVGVSNSQTGTVKFAHSGSAFIGSLVQGALSAGQTYTLPNATGTICLDSGNCLGGGGGGANTALSNLTSVAINTSLLPGVAGSINLGSGGLPFGDVFLAGASGTPGTNNFRLTGASTSGTRVITLPDAAGTVCLQSAAACGFAANSGNGNYIQNQNSADQAADFRISGTGRANTSVLTPLLDTATGVALALGTNNATAINLNQSTAIATGKSLTVGQDVTLQAANSSISNAQTTTHGESFGSGATTANDAVAFGFSAAALANSVAIGSGASTAATSGIAIGNGATAANQFGIALGRGATTTAANQLVVGSGTGAISQVFIGNGFSNAAPSDVTIQGTGGSGTDVAGASLNLSSGVGTGLGAGGNINFKVATPAGGTGSSANVAQTVATISGTNGAAVFKNFVNGTAGFDVQTQGGASILTVNSSTPGVTINGTATIQGGSGAGAVSVQAAASATISIGTANANTITVGNAASTAAITIGQSTASNTINIGNATTAAGNIQTINIGTSATSTGKAVITIGNTNDGSSLALQAGTGNVTLSTNSATSSVTVKSNTNSTAAFQILDSGNSPYLTANTTSTNPGIYISGTASGGGGGRLFFGNVGDPNTFVGEDADVVTPDNDRLALFGRAGLRFYTNTAPGSLTGTITANGRYIFQSLNDSQGGFEYQTQGGDDLLNISTAAVTVTIGKGTTNDSTGVLLVLDSKNTAGDPTGITGGMYYNNSSETFRCYTGAAWADCMGTPKPNARRWTYITYPGSGTSFNANGDITGGNIATSVPATTSEPAVLDYATAGTTNSATSLEGNPNYNSSANPTYQTYASIAGTTNTRMWLGFTDQSAATMAASANPAGNYAAFRYDTGAGDTAIKCVTKDGTTQNITNTFTAPTTAGHKYEIDIIQGTEVIFKLDGAEVCTQFTNSPAANTMLRYVNTMTTLTNAINDIRVGWVYIESDK